MKRTSRLMAVSMLVALVGCSTSPEAPRGAGGAPPQYRVDAAWPKPLPNDWILGQVSGLAVDSRNHVWILHRPLSILKEELLAAQTPRQAKCCVAAPPVIEFDPQGNVVRAWGGPGTGYDWPKNEHGLHVDAEGNVWVGANDPADNQVLKFTREGKFLMQIGKPGKSEGNNSTTQLGRPAHMSVDAAANEVYVADGYGNRRVIVFDATTGAYKRHWGAYGAPPSEDKPVRFDPAAPAPKFFNNAVHCVHLARDGLVYVCDRAHNRVQVFRKSGAFVSEFFVARPTLAGNTPAEIGFSPDPQQTWMFVADGTNGEVHVLSRADGRHAASFGRRGRMAGEFSSLHNIGADAHGNIYTAEAGPGRRVQRFVPTSH